MGVIAFFIEIVRGMMHIVDSIITPASTLLTLSKVNGIEAFTFYFYCDLPLNFRQSIVLQDLIRLYRAEQFNNYSIFKISVYYTFYKPLTNKILIVNVIDLTQHILEGAKTHSYESNTIALSQTLNNSIQNVISGFKNPYLIYESTSYTNDLVRTILYYSFKPVIIDASSFLWFLKPITSRIHAFCTDNIVVILDMMFSSWFFFFFFMFFFKFFVKVIRALSANAFIIQKLKKETDQEVSSLEDVLAFIIFFAVFFINNLNLHTASQLVEYNIHITFWALFICFYMIVILLPINILFTIGTAGFMYIKGCDKNNAIITYIILDVVVILSFFLRFLLQIIRWCLFLTTYYLLHEFVFEWTYNLYTYTIYSLNFVNETNYFKTNSVFINFFVQFIRYAFEIFDTCLILTIQITAFIAVILWLFNYLFSISLDDLYEAVFEDKINI